MRRREQSRVTSPDGAPPVELRVGTCIEVWSAGDGPAAMSAWRRHRAARRAWAEQHGIGVAEMCRVMPAGAPWSAAFLIETGRGDEVDECLARAGVTVADLPRLREAVARSIALSAGDAA